jgi:tetratricopeptide (TPR) repeat protein
MSDQRKLDEIRELRDRVHQFDPQVLEAALRIVESLEDRDDRDYYVSVLAEWSATGRGMKHLEKAIELTRSVKVASDRRRALVAIAKRLLAGDDRQRCESTLAEAEQAAEAVESDNGYLAWQKAEAWHQIADLYRELGHLSHATRVWSRAAKLAQSGQDSNDPQDARECRSILVEIVAKAAEAGLKDFAIETAQSITSNDWRKAALEKLSGLNMMDK